MNELFERALPRIIQAAFTAHSKDAEAHKLQFIQHVATCPVARKVDRLMWLLLGLAFGSGVAGGSILFRVFGIVAT